MPESNDEATSEKIKLRDIQQNKWPEIFSQRKTEELIQIEETKGHDSPVHWVFLE